GVDGDDGIVVGRRGGEAGVVEEEARDGVEEGAVAGDAVAGDGEIVGGGGPVHADAAGGDVGEREGAGGGGRLRVGRGGSFDGEGGGGGGVAGGVDRDDGEGVVGIW